MTRVQKLATNTTTLALTTARSIFNVTSTRSSRSEKVLAFLAKNAKENQTGLTPQTPAGSSTCFNSQK
jgi:hypothetical protein